MENTSNQPQSELGLDFWTKQFEYFDDCLRGLELSAGVLAHLRDDAKRKMLELTPDKEEIS